MLVNHLIGSFRTCGIGVALSGPECGWPPNCCITCSGFFPYPLNEIKKLEAKLLTRSPRNG
ncbi:hypothetical protein Hanom_Chr05g00444171 [Helianthus anomalus]